MEERLNVLKAMNTITSKISLKEFAIMVGLTPNQTLERVQELVKAGLVRKSGLGYGITEKGKMALKALDPVPMGMEFHFYTGIGHYTGFSAKNLKDFCELIKKAGTTAMEFHVSRGDFENWVKTTFDDAKLVEELARIRESKLQGETLRNEITKVIEARYNFEGIFAAQ